MPSIFVSAALAILASSSIGLSAVAEPGGYESAHPVFVQPTPWRTFAEAGQMEPAQRVALLAPATHVIVREPMGRILMREPDHHHAWWRLHHSEPVTVLLQPDPYHAWWRQHRREHGNDVHEFD